MSIVDRDFADAGRMPYDLVEAVRRLGGDADLFREVAEYFLVDSVELMQHLRAATSAADRKAIAAATHALVGAASAFGAARVIAEAARIGAAARDDDSIVVTDLGEMELALDELNRALRRLPDDVDLDGPR